MPVSAILKRRSVMKGVRGEFPETPRLRFNQKGPSAVLSSASRTTTSLRMTELRIPSIVKKCFACLSASFDSSAF